MTQHQLEILRILLQKNLPSDGHLKYQSSTLSTAVTVILLLVSTSDRTSSQSRTSQHLSALDILLGEDNLVKVVIM